MSRKTIRVGPCVGDDHDPNCSCPALAPGECDCGDCGKACACWCHDPNVVAKVAAGRAAGDAEGFARGVEAAAKVCDNVAQRIAGDWMENRAAAQAQIARRCASECRALLPAGGDGKAKASAECATCGYAPCMCDQQ